MKSKIQTGLITNLFALAVAAGGLILGQNIFPPNYFEKIVWGLMALAFVAAVAVYIYSAAEEWRVASEELKHEREALSRAERANRLSAILPNFLLMTHREDHYVIGSQGSGLLRWKFHLEHPNAVGRRTLTLPIYAERRKELDATPSKSVFTVKSLKVNSIPQPTVGAYEMKGLRSNGGKPQEEIGVVSVKLDLTGTTHSEVEVELSFACSYPDLARDESVFVDVPYITEHLMVSVAAEEGRLAVVPLTSVPTIHAFAGEHGVEDTEETYRQDRSLHQVGAALRWNTEYPKLGHRYRVWFRLISKEESQPAIKEARNEAFD
jgi:hypothetical protein